MVQLAVKCLGKGDRVALLGTTLTIESKLYEKPLIERGAEVLKPDITKNLKCTKFGTLEQGVLQKCEIT